MAVKEWRVRSVNRRGKFMCFGEDERAARYFMGAEEVEREITVNGKKQKTKVMQRIGVLSGEIDGEYQLQSRQSGIKGDDSTWQVEV